MHILKCEDPVELDELSFTVSSSRFGALQTIELEDGGTKKTVTLDNKSNYVHQMCQWYLTGTILVSAVIACKYTLTHMYTTL